MTTLASGFMRIACKRERFMKDMLDDKTGGVMSRLSRDSEFFGSIFLQGHRFIGQLMRSNFSSSPNTIHRSASIDRER